MELGVILTVVQFFFAVVIGLYFYNLLKNQQGSKVAVKKESRKEVEKLEKMRAISLSEPLSEKTRPSCFTEIIGQDEGLKALRAALGGANPQHVLIYGPPGVGKTAAARLILEEAKKNSLSPFLSDAKFVELDATTARFDERGIADPLIGSVHDPIYQGAGPLGMAGVPQPRPGAVTKAHGGILFIDEIGELHSVQMNKLLKVLEDRKVFLESAYYNTEDINIPSHIRDIFENGLPADFRMVGATTRMPHDIPPAIRSRCLEVFFRSLLPEEVGIIAENAARKIEYTTEPEVVEVLKRYATNGRDAVNMVQLAAGIAQADGRKEIQTEDMEWVVSMGQYSPRPERKMPQKSQVGLSMGLAVYGAGLGTLIEIEVSALKVGQGRGHLTVTGVIEEEEFGGMGQPLRRRKSMAKGSVENVLTILRGHIPGFEPENYDIHVNFPGGIPLDGPSAGVAIALAVYSAVTGKSVKNTVALSGEVSLQGQIKPVGGIIPKVDAAMQAGAKLILIPKENWQQSFNTETRTKIVPVSNLNEVIMLGIEEEPEVVHETPQQEISLGVQVAQETVRASDA